METETFPYMHSEGHAVAHLIGVLPIPGNFARPGIQVISPHVVINSPVPSALTVLILEEADYTRDNLKEELNCEEECNHRHCDSTYVKERTHIPPANYTLQLLIREHAKHLSKVTGSQDEISTFPKKCCTVSLPLWVERGPATPSIRN